MGRIRFIVIRTELQRHGYSVAVAVFNDVEVIRKETYDNLSWREAQQVADAASDHYRPGLELMAGGIQQALFE